jgi:hypothetical protein
VLTFGASLECMRPLSIVLSASLLSACSQLAIFTTSVHPTAGAPTLPPSHDVQVVAAKPEKVGPELAQLDAQGNNFAQWSDCRAKLAERAQALGAATIVVAPADTATPGAGVRCTGTAYGPAAP